MATHVSGAHAGSAAHTGGRSGFANGWIMFAATLMIFGGIMTLLAGLAAILKDNVFVATPNYTFAFDLTGWGWVHLIIGAVIIIAGLALFQGSMWARVFGVVLAGLGMLSNFLWLPYFPVWAIVLIAIDAFVIWALCVGPSRSGRRSAEMT